MAACKTQEADEADEGIDEADEGIDEMTKLMARLNHVERENQRLREELRELRARDEDERAYMDLKKLEEENARKKAKSNKIANVKANLKKGRLTKNMYEFVRDEVDTKTTRQNVVEAFKAYREALGEEVNEDLTFAKMLEEMKAIIDA
jgi:hypothetical protein